MTDIATRAGSVPGAQPTAALQHISEAMDRVVATKRTQSTELIEDAERELQGAVDAARDQQVQWGEIGSVLGIARGNAYRRYRRRLSLGDFPRGLGATKACRKPSL
jgi:hypothetical protein